MYLNYSAPDFKKIAASPFFVDKSALLDLLNARIGTTARYVLSSRPHGFGKSLTAAMLCAFYSPHADSAATFAPLAIARFPSSKTHRGRHPTIFIDMQKALMNEKSRVEDMLDALDAAIIAELQTAYADLKLTGLPRLNLALAEIAARAQGKFIIIIDNWDYLMAVRGADSAALESYHRYLQALLKDRPYVDLVYMTGLLPVKKFGTHGGLNMFDEFTMADPQDLAPAIYFAREEVLTLCDRSGGDFAAIKRCCGGYAFDGGQELFHPQGVLAALGMTEGRPPQSWDDELESLVPGITSHIKGLGAALEDLVEGKSLLIDTTTFNNDLADCSERDDFLTALIHLGYLSCDPNFPLPRPDPGESLAVRIPNASAKEALRRLLTRVQH